MNADVTIPRN